MAAGKDIKMETIETLFKAVLSLETMDDCYTFFKDLCTMKELNDMAQRFVAACMLLDGKTYEQIVKSAEISTATISRINRCIQGGEGGYLMCKERIEKGKDKPE